MKNPVLVVDDEPHVIRAIERALLDEDVEVIGAANAEDAETLLGKYPFKVVISDQCMPGMGGAEFLGLVSLRHPEIVRIMLTGHASLENIMKAVNSGEIYRFFTKPWSDMELRFALRSAIEKFDLEARVRQLASVARGQALKLQQLENDHPGITRGRTPDGAYDLSHEADADTETLLRELGVQL
jgi:two-component system, probable response regulator PhcQ